MQELGARMPEYRRAYAEGGTFFYTVVTYKRYPIFADEAAITRLQGCFRSVMFDLPYSTDAMVILPDHLHCIWTLPQGDADFSVRWKRIKAAFTRGYTGARRSSVSESMHTKNEGGVWQRRFWEHRIRDERDFNLHCDYIHYNPVKHGLASLPIEWKHSSFGEFVERGVYSPTWGECVKSEVTAMELE